jgi:ATP-binding cassette subfamily C protein LapB
MTNPDDSLLQCLMTLCRFHGGGTTAAAVCGGLPLQDGRLTPDLFERAAARVGLASKIVYRNIADI